MAPDDLAQTDPEADESTPYQALYRRYRPQRFADVLGQGHVTRPLQAAVRDGRVGHAYLFSGPRGTGKTTTARILAMALNCENPDDGEPCGRCGSCLAIRAGTSMDVQELDSATNRGIDEMRDLLSRVSLGTPGRWKVYIVDEVHQITSAAASALLKTLEEPPAHVIFVLATTDPQKVLETIRSRTQHFEFRLLGSEVLTSLLADVAERADIDLSPEAIDVVVRRGHGSARDALSALDQAAASGGVEDQTVPLSDLVEALIGKDAAQMLVQVAESFQAGVDARRLATDLLEYLRNGFLATRAPSLVLLSESAVQEVAEQARRMGAAALVRAMDLVGQALIDMRDSADARITLEVALVRLSAPEVDDSPGALLERIERLERGAGPAAGTGGSLAPAREPAAVASPPAPPAPPTAPPEQAVSRPVPAAPGPPEAPATAPRPRPPSAPSRPAPPAGSAAPTPSSGGALPPPPPPPAARSGVVSPAPGRPAPPAPARLPSPGTGERASTPAPLAPSASPATPERSAPADESAPSREELTMAWGDEILPALRPAVKVYVSNGRFLPSDGAHAVYALSDRGLLVRAEVNRAEVEKALSDHFGRSVRLRLVLDGDAAPVPAAAAAVEPLLSEEEEMHDWAQMEEASAAVVSPEQRLLEAFPGAEEVIP